MNNEEKPNTNYVVFFFIAFIISLLAFVFLIDRSRAQEVISDIPIEENTGAMVQSLPDNAAYAARVHIPTAEEKTDIIIGKLNTLLQYAQNNCR